MLEFDEELEIYFLKFEEKFNDIVPLRQISAAVTKEQLIQAIEKSLKEGKNLLPEIFGFKDSSKDKLY